MWSYINNAVDERQVFEAIVFFTCVNYRCWLIRVNYRPIPYDSRCARCTVIIIRCVRRRSIHTMTVIDNYLRRCCSCCLLNIIKLIIEWVSRTLINVHKGNWRVTARTSFVSIVVTRTHARIYQHQATQNTEQHINDTDQIPVKRYN